MDQERRVIATKLRRALADQGPRQEVSVGELLAALRSGQALLLSAELVRKIIRHLERNE